ncbi:MAG TPA: YceI family protein [Candidatus Paceibacterota bacterium]
MNSGTKATLITVLVLAVLVGLYFYLTRPVATSDTPVTPSENLDTTSATQKKLNIVSAESSAQFTLNEDLRGKKTKVIGTTNQIAGEIIVDTKNPAEITIGEIKVDARTLKTDNEQRNGALARFILKTEETGNEYITFKSTAVTDVPAVITPNTPFNFSVVGYLTVRGSTKLVTFEATGVWKDDNSFSATASTTVAYADFGLSIPDLPFLANVDKNTTLTVSVVAR